jgi:Clp amino terminal domain, pathogenicity island component
MYETFTIEARQVLAFASDEARHLHHAFIGTDAILAALIEVRDGVGASALGLHGIQLFSVRDALRRGQGPAPSLGRGLPFTLSASAVLEGARTLSGDRRDAYVGTAHLLVGLLRETGCTANSILMDLGADPERLEREVLALMPGDEDPSAKVEVVHFLEERPLRYAERELLTHLLAEDAPECEVLRTQIEHIVACACLDCDFPSVRLRVDEAAPRSNVLPNGVPLVMGRSFEGAPWSTVIYLFTHEGALSAMQCISIHKLHDWPDVSEIEVF